MSLNLDKSTWKRLAFGDVIENVTDRVDNPAEAGVDRYVGLEHLDPGVLTVQRWDTPDKVEAQKLRFQPADVIFGRRRAYQKKVALAEFEGICSAHALVLRARPDYVHPEFLPVFLASDYFLDRAIAISVGSLSPTVNWRDLKVQEFDLPALDEQKRLANLLWAVERDRMARVVTAHHLARVRSALVRDRLLDAPVQVDPLEALTRPGTTITYGIVQAGPEVPDGVPYIRVSDMTNGRLGLTDMKRTAPEIAHRFLRSRVEVGDLVVALRGRTGLTLRVPEELDGANLTQGTARVAIDEELVRPDYVLAVMNSDWMSSEVTRRAKGSTFSELTLASLKQLPIPRLGADGERTLILELEAIDAAVRVAAAVVKTVEALRATLCGEIFGR